jgi:hypothetical protein
VLIHRNNNDQHGKQEEKQKSKLCKWIPNDSTLVTANLPQDGQRVATSKLRRCASKMLYVSFVFPEFKIRMRDIARTNEPEMRREAQFKPISSSATTPCQRPIRQGQ